MTHPILRRKLRRDLWRQRTQFGAVAVVVAIGVAVFIAASDAYRNLDASFDRAYATQRLPDSVLTGPASPSLGDEAARLPGRPALSVRLQSDVAVRIGDQGLIGRVVSLPDGRQPDVARIALRTGRLPGPDEVLVEQHLADHFRLSPGDRLTVQAVDGWRSLVVSGSGLSAEYFWPARSQQELMTSPEQFGVLFARESLASSLADPQRQLALYARDRGRAGELVAAAATLGRAHDLVVADRSTQPSYVALDQDVRTFGEFANFLPLLFLLAGVLGAFILLSRLVHSQRAVIGTLAANGIGPRTLRRHYLRFGVVAGLAAAPPGVVGGYFLGAWFTTRYTDALGLPLHVTALHPFTLLAGPAAGVIAAGFAAWGPARAAGRVAPAEAMRIAPSGSGRPSIAERLVPPLRRVPARWRMVLRGLTRNRRRAVLTIAGVVVSLSLVLVFAGLRDTVSAVLDRQYGVVDRSDGQLYAVPGDAPAVLAAAGADPAVAVVEPFARAEVNLSHGADRYDTLLLGLPVATTLHRFADSDGARLALDERGGVLLGEGLRHLLAIEVGDVVTITFTTEGRTITEPVAGFSDEPMAAVAYVALAHLDTSLGRDATTGALVRLHPGIDRKAVARRLGALPGAAAYLDNAAIEATIRDAFAMMDVLVGVMLAFAVIMAAALLFNAMSANLAERTVELGTLHTAGLSRGMLARLVAAENLLLTVTGLPLGLLAGVSLARWFMGRYENLGYRWTLQMRPGTLVVVTAAVLGASLLSQLPVLRSIGRIDSARIVRERSL